MIKLNVGLSRKVSDNNYGSKGGNVSLEVEVDSSLTRDSSKLQGYIHDLFEMVRTALDAELQSYCEPAYIEVKPHLQSDCTSFKGNGADNETSTAPVRYATEKQILCIQGLARKSGIPVVELLKKAGVRLFNDMTVRQASQMIESLKGSSAN